MYIIAGPNGAGKTTFAHKFLPHYVECLEFVNADLIAGGLSPFDPERAATQAGRLMLEQIHSFGKRGLDFGFETTLSRKTYVKLLKDLKKRDILSICFFSGLAMLSWPSNALNFACEMEAIIFLRLLSFVVSIEACPIFFDSINPWRTLGQSSTTQKMSPR